MKKYIKPNVLPQEERHFIFQAHVPLSKVHVFERFCFDNEISLLHSNTVVLHD